MMSADGVDLQFTEGSLKLIAHEAMKRRTGARGLRSILEGTMNNVMYEVPSMKGVAQCLITEDTIRDKSEPTLVTREQMLRETRARKEEKEVINSEDVDEEFEEKEAA